MDKGRFGAKPVPTEKSYIFGELKVPVSSEHPTFSKNSVGTPSNNFPKLVCFPIFMLLAEFGWVYFLTQAMQTEKSDIVGKLMSSLVEVNQPLVDSSW